jgi:hypothetical protein
MSIPWGFLGMIGLMLTVESSISRRHPDLAPDYSLEWRKTGRVVHREAPRSEIICLGDSLVKVGVAPRVLEQSLGKRTFDFALSAGQPVASYFMLRRVLETGARPEAVLLDSKWTALACPPTLNEPILPEIVGPREFLDLAWNARDGRLFASLILAELLPSYRDRFAIRADVKTALRGESPPPRRQIGAWQRNWRQNHGAHHAPRVPGHQGKVDPNNKELFPDDWKPDPVVASYLERLFALAESRGIPVFWLVPPTVPEVLARHERVGTDRAFTRFARQLQARFPNVVVIDGRYAGYPPSVFIDPTHLDCRGAALFTDDLAPIIGRSLSDLAASPRWVALPPYRDRTIGIDLEDVEQSARIIAAGPHRMLR